MTLISAAVNAVPADIELFANKLFSIVGFICLPLLALVLILICLIMAFFIFSFMIDCLRKIYHEIFKRRLESEDDKQ